MTSSKANFWDLPPDDARVLSEPLSFVAGGASRECASIRELEAVLSHHVRYACALQGVGVDDEELLRDELDRVRELAADVQAGVLGADAPELEELVFSPCAIAAQWAPIFSALFSPLEAGEDARLLGLAKYERYLALRLQGLGFDAAHGEDRDEPAAAASRLEGSMTLQTPLSLDDPLVVPGDPDERLARALLDREEDAPWPLEPVPAPADEAASGPRFPERDDLERLLDELGADESVVFSDEDGWLERAGTDPAGSSGGRDGPPGAVARPGTAGHGAGEAASPVPVSRAGLLRAGEELDEAWPESWLPSGSEREGAALPGAPEDGAGLVPDSVPSVSRRDDGDSTHDKEAPAGVDFNGWTRLERGRDVVLRLEGRKGVDLHLADHRFRLRLGRVPALFDPATREHRLEEGSNHVGRSPGNDVVVHEDYASVSRRHLVIEIANGRLASIRDLSAHGTFVPTRHLEEPG